MARNTKKRKCTGHTTNGEPCDAWAIRGGTVCVTHGGAAPQTKRAASKRLALDAAQRMVLLAGVDQDPIEHLLECLQHAAQLVKVWGVMVAALDDTAEAEAREQKRLRGELHYSPAPEDSFDGLSVSTNERLLGFNYRGEAQIHPFMVEFEAAIDRRAKFAKMCMDAGIAERQIQMVEAQVEMTQRALEAALEAAGLDKAGRQEARREFARHLRVVG